MVKKFLPIFLVLALLIGLLSGCKEGWTEPPEEDAGGDITLSGQMYGGKVAVVIDLHPDGTLSCDANGEKTEGTWEVGSGDVAMVAHYPVKGTDYDMDITETEDGYTAECPVVPGLTLTGKKAAATPKDITLSGQMYGGKVAVVIDLHPDGTLSCDANGEKTEGTWEAGSGDVAMVAHYPVKGTDYDMDITETEDGYTAECPVVPGLILTGKKGGGVVSADDPAESDTPTDDPAATGEPANSPEPMEYPENSLVLDFTPDTSEQLQKMFYVESSTWGPALGASGDYTPTESEDELFAWITTGSSVHLTLYANGTYKYEFTTMNIEETGTWTFEGYKMTLTTAKGVSYESTIAK